MSKIASKIRFAGIVILAVGVVFLLDFVNKERLMGTTLKAIVVAAVLIATAWFVHYERSHRTRE